MNEDHKTDTTESPDVLPQAEITKINASEYAVDITGCHGLEMETGDLSDLLPGPAVFTALARDRVQTAMEQTLAEAGGSLPVGGKLLLHLNSAGPGAILDIAISAKEEGIMQATLSSTAGTVAQIVVTGAVGSTPLAPIAPLVGIVAGSLVNTGVDWTWGKVTEIKDRGHEDTTDALPSSPETITFNMTSGTLTSDLPLESNLEVVDSLRQQGHIITQLEGSDGIRFTNIQDNPKAEVLYHDDGSPAIILDPDNNWSVEYKEDASGIVYIGTDDNQQTIPFNPNDKITIDYQSDSNIKVSVIDSKGDTPLNNNIENPPPPQTDYHGSNSSGQTTQAFDNYTIQPGDTLSELAKANNTTVENILIFNLEIDNPDQIKAGYEIVIPPEDWEFPLPTPMTDADGNPILLASNDDSFAEHLLRNNQSGTSSSEEEPPQTELEDNTEYWVNPTFTDYLKILVPTYGLYCGPGWFAGERTSREYAPPSENPWVEGVDDVDKCCMTHDFAYEKAENQPNEAALLHEADIQLLEDLGNLPQESIDGLGVYGILYLPLMIELFEAKVVVYDVTHSDKDSSNLSYEEVVGRVAERLDISFEQAETRLQQLENPDLLIADGVPYSQNQTDQIAVTKEESDTVQSEAEAEESEQQIPQADLNKEFLNLMSSESDLRDAINTGNGWDMARTGAGFVSGLDDYADALPGGGDGFLSESNGSEAIVDGIEHGIGFGQAVDEGDGWGIAGNSIDLLRDIESYMDANGGGFLDAEGVGSGATALNIASAGFALADAIEDGDGWGIASSSTELIRGIDQYSDSINLGENTMSGIGSAIGLASNIASFDDVLESGDAVRIAYQTVSTVNNAIMTYNAIAGVVDGLGVISGGLGSVGSLLGTTGSIAGSIPVMSILAIGAQLAMGDVRGAAVTAATTVLMACGPWGWAAAAVLQIANMLMTEDPPSATADFALDENGNVIMDVHGDSDMKESVRAAGSPLIAIIQKYKELGGRVTIDGSLPSLRMEAGKDPEIKYTSEYGGKVVISVADRSRLGLDMRGALYARDRGDRVDDAIKLARDSSGNIDFAKVDASLAAMGFVKRGMTYTYGESWTPRVGVTYGNGVFTGGGNANGPQGQHFVAGDKDIKSLPLTPEQRPSQTVGKLLSAVSLQHNFAGASGLLLAMGLGLDVDQACASAFYGQIEHPETNIDYVKPLDAAALESYLTNGNGPYEQQSAQPTDSNTIPPITDETDLQAILSSQLPGLGSTFDPFAEQSGVSGFSFAKAPALPATSYSNIPEWWQELSASDFYEYFYPDQKPVDVLLTNNILISETDLPSGFEAPPLPEGTSQGVYFSMVQDSSLRFLASSLVQETSYSSSAESYTLLSYGNVQHGTLYEDVNGDLRFAADEGFAGTASFEYTLLGPSGETITRRALIVVEDQNDLPELNPDHFIIYEGDSFYLDQLLTNDSDADGDPITLDHFRGLEHGTITEINNRLLFTPEKGFTGTLNFSYMAHDGTYPQRGEASLTILDENLGPVPTDDRFIILEDHSLTTTVDKLLANDHEYDGETIQLTGVHGARHGQVSMDTSGTVTFIPDADYAGTEAGFSYTVTDQSDNLSTGFAAIEVLDQREAPQVSSTTYPAINEDEPITFCPEEIARFVSDADGDQLHLDFITNIEHGSVVVENGFFKFIPEAGYSGIASFDYQANDSHRGTVQGHLEFEILPVNDPVAMGADSFQTTEETPLLIAVGDLLANDSDPEGGSVHFVSVGDAEHGSVSVDANNNITFTPNSNYFGAEAGFNYTIKDDEGLESTAFVGVEVTGSNDAPEILTDTLSTNEDQAITFDASTIERFLQDVDGDNVTLTGIVNVNGGVVSEENGLYTFTPTPTTMVPLPLITTQAMVMAESSPVPCR
ncbi:LysM domain-containing protein [Desulfocapsa sulfexigens DSM 10523]|uniref:LysM domain-containing protein n=1 Tax=Desulfocapsa sulfexigens (strain DSM 10523 / SB164P1) TaxID=1167006 RepID=M1PB74_DESSD|nr:cadherin-like domain-containing protein [Desulfocapsa sulfexigens]AGF76990.1 LysM domain-containing protein [Desulfocapsa sulfexigens DSM 10523]